jgi:hypothetical protein
VEAELLSLLALALYGGNQLHASAALYLEERAADTY